MSKFEESKKDGMHHKLSLLAGEWEGVTKTWFEPDKIGDESPMKGTMKIILDGRFILHEYKGSIEGKPLEGISIYGYDMVEGCFQSVNIDSFHSGTTIMMQNGVPGTNKLSALGSYTFKASPEEIYHWGWRTEIDMVDNDNLLITIYNISPEGESAKAVETAYKRIK